MRLLSRLLVVSVLCFVAIVLPTAPAQAQGTYITVSPDDGVPGTEVTVRGYNFTDREWVDIHYYGNYSDSSMIHMAVTEINAEGYFRVDFEIPESYKGPHKVLAEDDKHVEAYDYFTVKPGLTIDLEEGPVGTNVTVEGHGFAQDETAIELTYYWEGPPVVVAEDIEADGDGWWEQDFAIPPSDRGSHKIDAQSDETRSTKVKDAYFEVKPGISILDGPSGDVVDEPSGSPGDSITMTGSGFAANERDIAILFDGEEVLPDIRFDADDTGYWEEDFEVPERPKGEYGVTAEGDRTDQEDVGELDFEIEPGLRLFPVEGHVGTNLTVTGGGFAAKKNVDIEYDEAEIEPTGTPRTNADGSFQISFDVLPSGRGDRVVLAEDAEGNNATAIFVMESEAPGTPEPISPPDGDRTGFIGKVRLTFNWSDVADISGVRYNLQIAASDNITDTGFADPIREIRVPVGSNYTLDKTEALPHGTYYWSVQAVDGAENGSGWTEPRSFRIGVMPLWAFIAIVVVVAGGIGAAVYFLVIRRRIYYY